MELGFGIMAMKRGLSGFHKRCDENSGVSQGAQRESFPKKITEREKVQKFNVFLSPKLELRKGL